MKIVQTDEVPVTGSPKVRGGSGHSSQIMFSSDVLGRDSERPDNFFMQVSYLEEGQFSTPRHRHNFEQFRFMVQGTADYPEGQMTDGTLGYFPEGVYYGPQQKVIGTTVIVQFGGPSGSGFVDRKQMRTAFEALQADGTGVFRDGTFYRNPGVEGPPEQDGNEAIIEYTRKTPVVYPQGQYATPILINSNAFPWTPLHGAAGVEEKALGTFSSAKLSTARYKLDPGATLPAVGRALYLVLSGTGQLAEEPFRILTALYLEEGENTTFTASDTSDILMLGLPIAAYIANSSPEELEYSAPGPVR
jgi:hypothetical protein